MLDLFCWGINPGWSNVTPVNGIVEYRYREFCCLELTSTRLVMMIDL